MKRGNKPLAYKYNRWKLRRHRYGTPVHTIFGDIPESDLYAAHMFLSGQWGYEKAFRHMKSIT